MNNKSFYYLFLILIIGCSKNGEQSKLEIIRLSGQVKNKESGTAIDSAQIMLAHSFNFSFLPDTEIYSDVDRKFNLQFSPGENVGYELQIDKPGFSSSLVSIDRDKEFQNFNISLDTH